MDIVLYCFLTSPTESPVVTPARNRKSLRRTGSDSPTTLLKTISEIPVTNSDDPVVKTDEKSEEDPLHSEEGSSSSLRSGESGIDMTDGLFSWRKKDGGIKSPGGGGGVQNGNRSPGIGMENVMTSTPRDPKMKSKLEFTSSKENEPPLTKSAEWSHCE